MIRYTLFRSSNIFLLLIFFVSCTAQDARDQHNKQSPNRLIESSSPYLLQHAYNPVDWYPWSEEAFKKAEKEGKLVIISIGYAACHWCHVMEHESFEDDSVAQLMNREYISIKVDREERPDVDAIYMDACGLMNKEGCGWPLNIIALPDKRPIFSGTYFPKDNWLTILDKVREISKNSPEKTEEIATQLSKAIQSMQAVSPVGESLALEKAAWEKSNSKLLNQLDHKYGGMIGAPKFPMPAIYEYLLHYNFLYPDPKVQLAINTYLREMAKGGIYDHLDGGFSRYSTDAKWFVPHFEKMLYDNGQLLSLYSRAYAAFKDPLYKEVCEGIIAFATKELLSSEGGFYSSLNADSEGEEGKYYVWSAEEIEQILGEKSKEFKDFYQVSTKGNWEEEKNILHLKETLEAYAKQQDLSADDVKKSIQTSIEKLSSVRNKRIKPSLDDKQITSWNGMMIIGLLDAYRALGNEQYLELAKGASSLLKDQLLQKNGKLSRIFKNGTGSIPAFLDDYAWTAKAFSYMYQLTFDKSWLESSALISQYAIDHFFDEQTKMFFYTSVEEETLISRKRELGDRVIPSSNALMASALYELGTLLYKDEWKSMAFRMVEKMVPMIKDETAFHAYWASVMLSMQHDLFEVAITGPEALRIRQEIDNTYRPNILYLGLIEQDDQALSLLENKWFEGQTTIFVCKEKVCKLPVTEAVAAQKLLNAANN